MAWTLGGKRIVVTSDAERPDAKLSEHIVLDGTESIIHNFGYGAGTRSLNAYLLDNFDDYSYLLSGYNNGTSLELVSDQGSEGYYRIWTLNRKRVQDLKRSKPVLVLDIELKRA